VYVIK